MQDNPVSVGQPPLEEKRVIDHSSDTRSASRVHFWELLTGPHASVQKPDERRQAQFLATMLLILTPLGLALIILPRLATYNSVSFQQPFSLIVLIATVFAFISYGLSRSPNYKAGSALTVALITFVAFAIPLTGTQTFQLEMVFYLVLAVLLSSILLSIRTTIVLVALQILVLLVLPSVSANFIWDEVMWSRLGFIVVISTAILLITHYRDLLEFDRRQQLETTKRQLEHDAASRAAEMEELNAELKREIADHQFAERVINETYAHLEERIAERTTELSNANAQLQEQIGERARAEAAEREQRILAEGLRDTAAAINSVHELDEILDRILVFIERILPYDSASIMMIDAGVAYVVHGRGFGEHEGDAGTVLSVRLPIEQYSNLKEMYETGRPVIIPDTQDYPTWLKVEATEWIRSNVGAPIRSEGKIIGFINLDSRLAHTFNASHAEKLLAFADQAGIAIRNANLFEAIQEHANELEARVAERTATLERDQAQMRAIMNSMGEGLFSQIHGDNASLYQNAALLRMTGYPAGEVDLLQLNPTTMTHEEFIGWLQLIRDTVRDVGYWQGELRLRRKDGSEFDAQLTSSRINNQDGEMIGSVTVIRDVSQEKALQDLKSRFVANASHELRTPLTNLITRLYLLRKQPQLLEQHLDVLDRVATRMRNLVEDLLDHSRFERGVILLKLRSVDARELIRDVVEMQVPEGEKKDIHLTTELPEKPFIIMVDPERLSQAITNLVINAIYYTPEHGKIRVRLVREEVDVTCCRTTIQIQDTGPGIPADILPNLFLPFYRGSENTKGTGLGLTIAKEITELHGGIIRVESPAEGGSNFIIQLPCSPEEA